MRTGPWHWRIDATGDAQVLAQVGVPTVEGDNYFTYYGEGITPEGCRRALETGNLFHAYSRPFGGTADLHGRQQPAGKAPYHGVSMETINAYLQENQLLMLNRPVTQFVLQVKLFHRKGYDSDNSLRIKRKRTVSP